MQVLARLSQDFAPTHSGDVSNKKYIDAVGVFPCSAVMEEERLTLTPLPPALFPTTPGSVLQVTFNAPVEYTAGTILSVHNTTLDIYGTDGKPLENGAWSAQVLVFLALDLTRRRAYFTRSGQVNIAGVTPEQMEALIARAFSHHFLIRVSDWNGDTKTCVIPDLVIPNPAAVDFGLPTPTTRINANEFAAANIIVTEVGSTYVVLNALTIPQLDVMVALRY